MSGDESRQAKANSRFDTGDGRICIKGRTSPLSLPLSHTHLTAWELSIQQLDIITFFGHLLLSYGYLLSRYLATTEQQPISTIVRPPPNLRISIISVTDLPG